MGSLIRETRTDVAVPALYISTRPEEYGHFVFKDGENSLTFHVSDAEGDSHNDICKHKDPNPDNPGNPEEAQTPNS